MVLVAWYPMGRVEHDSLEAIQITCGDTVSILETKLQTNVLMRDSETVL